MKKMTEHARTAKAIRKELKKNFPDVKFSVRGNSFAGGDDVRIEWTDGPSEKAVEKVVNKYQYGDFDGMRDIYEYTNTREDIPQVKYVLCHRTLSAEYMIKLLQKHDIEARPEDLNETNQHLKDTYGVWTFRQLAWRFSQREEA
jgi:hypothetical protein